MEKLRYTCEIDAPREKVWETMLGEATYRDWTSAFSPGSHFVGDWSEGSKMLFLAPDKDGSEGGMVARIKTNRPHAHVAIEHLGLVQDGREDTTSEAVKGWAGAIESYTLEDVGGRTELLVEMDSAPEYRAMFEEAWPKALHRLKELAEG